MVLATVALLVSASGVIATLIPYASEIYPVHLRATGSGLIAASSKLGGILGAGLGVAGLFGDVSLSALAIAAPMLAARAAAARNGIDTRGRGSRKFRSRPGRPASAKPAAKRCSGLDHRCRCGPGDTAAPRLHGLPFGASSPYQ
jgi:putative MFS transporter